MPGNEIVRRRVAAIAVLVTAAVVILLLVRSGDDERESTALGFAQTWANQDFQAMRSTLTPSSRSQTSVSDLASAYEEAQAEATVIGIGVEDAQSAIEVGSEEVVPIDVVLRTRLFGEIAGSLLVPVTDEGVRWAPHLVFPGLEQGEQLRRETEAPSRGSILARDGGMIAGGPPEARSVEIEGASQIAGTVAVPTGEQAEAARERGFPDDALLGSSGLELALDELLAGSPGGKLLAAGPGTTNILARTKAKPGRDVKTTIDPAAQAVATAALGSRFGGVTVLDEEGRIRALAGVAFSAPQPPGSTFKLITTAAALESGETTPGEEFPVQTGAVIDGREISNAYDESCGGTLVASFAHSCNSVFAPLGVRVGGEKLVAMAEQLGFNEDPDLLGGELSAAGSAQPSTIPAQFESDLDLGVSAIGQGQVLATPLAMASVTQTIAAGGKRTPPFVYREKGGASETTRAISAKTARQLTEMMEAVVREGTAPSAQIPGVRVAGKTGTAELGPKADQELPPPDPDNPDAAPPELELEVDAWFTAFAPAQKPRLIVAVMLINADGDGGTVAAPIAREILAALL